MDKRVEEWMKARLEREKVLQAEAFNSFINNNLSTPLSLSSISLVSPANKDKRPKTRESYIRTILTTPTERGDNPKTLEDVLHVTKEVGARLERTGIYSSVSASLLRSPSDPHSVEIKFISPEKSRFFLRTSTELGENEGTASLHSTFTNIFGAGEYLNAHFATGTRTRRNVEVGVGAPLPWDGHVRNWIVGRVWSKEEDLTAISSCMKGVVGGEFGFKKTGDNVITSFLYTTQSRSLHSLAPTASLAIRESVTLNPELKSSLLHLTTFDSRDDPITPTSGFKLSLENELANPALGLGLTSSSANFFKTELSANTGRSLRWLNLPSVSLSTTSRAGFLHSLQQDRNTSFSDRFHLGGPTSVRSFHHSGLGPHAGADALGSTAYYSFGLSLFGGIKLPGKWGHDSEVQVGVETDNEEDGGLTKKRLELSQRGSLDSSSDSSSPPTKPTPESSQPVSTYPFLWHLWLNGGRGVGSPTLPSSFRELQAHGPSVSAGVGLVYRFTPLRLELNLGLPLVQATGEKNRKGIQVGVGLEFL